MSSQNMTSISEWKEFIRNDFYCQLINDFNLIIPKNIFLVASLEIHRN